MYPDRSLLALAALLTACDSSPSKPPEDGPDDPCPLLTLGELSFDGQDDVRTGYSATLDQQLESDIGDYLVLQFYNYNERQGALGSGSFALDTAPNDNLGTCPECVSVWVDNPSPLDPPAKWLFQSGGSITLDVNPRTRVLRGHIDDLRLVEVTIDPMTMTSTPVEGGACARFDRIDLDFSAIPATWTCELAAYADGATCDCECGELDPDCDTFTGPVLPVAGCEAEEICYSGACAATCSLFEPRAACDSGVCLPEMPHDVCVDFATVDAAALGGTCEPYAFLCAADGEGLAQGICHFDDSVCRPLCLVDQDCGQGEICGAVAFSQDGTESKGYCIPEA